MVVEYLGPADGQRLLDLLSDGDRKFSSMEKIFKESFSEDVFFKVSRAVQRIVRDMIATPEGVGLVSSLFVFDIMCKMGCEQAKSAFYDALLELERVMRQDVCMMEQVKYASKEGREGRRAHESVNAERYRLRSAAKNFAFRLLANRVGPEETPFAAIGDKQELIDAALNTWEGSSGCLKEPVADLARSWTLEADRNGCGTLSRISATFDNRGRAALMMKPVMPQLPSLSLVSGELQFLSPAASLNDLLLINSELPTEEWRTAKRMVVAGCKGLLNKDEQQRLLQTLLSGDVFVRVGINSGLLSRMAEHNPDVAASLILKLPPQEANQCVQGILKSTIPSEHVETVLLHASKVLQQTSFRAYITNKLQYFKEKPALSTDDKNAVKNFVRTLHQLLTKASKENKEIYVADTLKADITRLCEKCDLPEVVARWDELK